MRVCSADSIRFISSVEIYQQMMNSSFFCNSTIKINHFLIISLHEVNLYPFYSPFLIQGHCFIHFIFECFPGRPKDDAYVLFLTIINKFRNVYILYFFGYIF